MPAMSQREINCRRTEKRKVSEKSAEEKRNRRERERDSLTALFFRVPSIGITKRARAANES